MWLHHLHLQKTRSPAVAALCFHSSFLPPDIPPLFHLTLKTAYYSLFSQFRTPQLAELTHYTIYCPSRRAECRQSLSISIFSLLPLSTEYCEIKLKDLLWRPCK